jgi:ribonuclease D
MPPGVVKHCGEQILEQIRSAGLPDELPTVNLRARPDPTRTAALKQLSVVQRTAAAELAVSPEVLATRRDLERLAEGHRDVAPLRGWRRAVIGERLLAVL